MRKIIVLDQLRCCLIYQEGVKTARRVSVRETELSGLPFGYEADEILERFCFQFSIVATAILL